MTILSYFQNPFKLLQVKNSLFNLNIFSNHLIGLIMFYFQRKLKYVSGLFSVCCYQILYVLETSELNSKWLWDLQ